MTEEKKYWLDRSENVTRLYQALWVLGVALLVGDLLIHKHEEFAFAGWFGYYGIFGFFACVTLILLAKALRRVIKRSEDYYER